MSDTIKRPIKEDSRPPLGMWASGRYFCECLECGGYFAGDKRATQCADCAYALHSSFTLDEVMSALSEAFERTHPRSMRDCRVEAKLRDILSARSMKHPKVKTVGIHALGSEKGAMSLGGA